MNEKNFNLPALYQSTKDIPMRKFKCDIMSNEDAEKLFFQEKPTLALLFIGSMDKTYASVISKEIDSTFAHTTRILSKMEQCGLLRSTFEGRIKFVELTEYGRKVETALKEFRDIIGDKKETRKKENTGLEGEKEKEKTEEEKKEKEKTEEEKKEKEKEELDPANARLLEKIWDFRGRIERLYGEAVRHGDSCDTITLKLGPCSRDIKKLRDRMEVLGTPVDKTVKEALEESEELLESYLNR